MLQKFLKSRKAVATAIGVAIVVLTNLAGLPEAEAKEIVTLIAVYVGAQGAADFGKEKQ